MESGKEVFLAIRHGRGGLPGARGPGMLGDREGAWANESTVSNEVGLFWVLNEFRG